MKAIVESKSNGIIITESRKIVNRLKVLTQK